MSSKRQALSDLEAAVARAEVAFEKAVATRQCHLAVMASARRTVERSRRAYEHANSLRGARADRLPAREVALPTRQRSVTQGSAAVDLRQWSWHATPDCVAAARAAIGQHPAWGDLAPGLCDAIALCVSEAVTNAVVHGYADSPQGGVVEMEAVAAEGALCVFVRDRGSGPVGPLRSPGLGVGLPLMATLADDFDISARDTGGTEVALRFLLARER